MHPNPIFRKSDTEKNIAFAQQNSFGTLSINDATGPLIAHIPFLLSNDGTRLEAHLVRSNPIARALTTEQSAVICINGPHGYISPDWYGVADQVPTWNYVAVHLRGRLRLLPDDDLRGVLDRLSTSMEQHLLPKPIWSADKMNADALNRMMRQIIPIEMDVEKIDGTWKLGQNKPTDARLGAAEALKNTGFGVNYPELADLMKNPPA